MSSFGMFVNGQNKQEGPSHVEMGGDNPVGQGMSKLTEKLGDKYIKPMLGLDQATVPAVGGEAGGALGSELGGGMGAGEAAGALEGAEAAGAAAEGLSSVEAAGAASEGLGGSELLVAALAKGGRVNKVNAMVSPGEGWVPPGKVHQVAAGKTGAMEKIPGKPKVKGDSLKNDTVPKKLDVGGIVIPNSIMQSKNPAKGAKDFVAKIIAKRKGKK